VLTGLSGAALAADRLIGRAVLPAATFAEGPTSGQFIGDGPINGAPVPFVAKHPVQGFSAILDNGNGTFLAMSDNGFGGLENSADYNLRLYAIRPDFKSRRGGNGTIEVLGHIELSDPDGHVPFAITNHFTEDRVLTGADFDIESIQQAPDSTLWIGEEFGPFLLHADITGKLLAPPFPLPDFRDGGEIRSPQNPFNEETSSVRIMNAVRTHAQVNGNTLSPVVSPWQALLADGNASSAAASRETPPTELAPGRSTTRTASWS
jgi:glycerophosphoryl diester phosphodiesterase